MKMLQVVPNSGRTGANQGALNIYNDTITVYQKPSGYSALFCLLNFISQLLEYLIKASSRELMINTSKEMLSLLQTCNAIANAKIYQICPCLHFINTASERPLVRDSSCRYLADCLYGLLS
jgi:hypothetical protein